MKKRNRFKSHGKGYLTAAQKSQPNFNALQRRRILKSKLRADCIARGADFEEEWADFEKWERSERGLCAACCVIFVICLCSLL